MKERLNQIEPSRWVKRNMVRISKQLSVNSTETEERLLDLLLRIEMEGQRNLNPLLYNAFLLLVKDMRETEEVTGIQDQIQG